MYQIYGYQVKVIDTGNDSGTVGVKSTEFVITEFFTLRCAMYLSYLTMLTKQNYNYCIVLFGIFVF